MGLFANLYLVNHALAIVYTVKKAFEPQKKPTVYCRCSNTADLLNDSPQPKVFR